MMHNKNARGRRGAGMRKRPAFPGRVLVLTLTGLMTALLWGNSLAPAEEAAVTEEPSSEALGEDITHMDESFREKPRGPGFFPSLKEQLKDTSPFFRDTDVDVNLRTYYFDRTLGDTESVAWAVGGALAYRSGWLSDRLGAGATLYTSQPLYAPDHKDGTGLLKPGQQGYTVAGELYARVKVADETVVKAYRYEVETPYVNKNDSRMTPNTIEGYTFSGTTRGKDGAPTVTYGGGYLARIKLRNSDTFISLSEAAGASVDRGVLLGGVNASYASFSIGAIDYYSEDIINIGYGEARYTAALSERAVLRGAVQFTDQRSAGEDLLTGEPFKTNQAGVSAEMSSGGASVTLAYTTNAHGSFLRSPWGIYPGYTNVQLLDFSRAGEDAFLVKGAYDLSELGLEGVTAYALWARGWGAADPLASADEYNADEYDLDLQWKPKGGDLKGFWFRVRYAHADQHGLVDAPLDELRVIVNYDLSLL